MGDSVEEPPLHGALAADIGRDLLGGVAPELAGAENADAHVRLALDHRQDDAVDMLAAEANEVGVDERENVGPSGARARRHSAAFAGVEHELDDFDAFKAPGDLGRPVPASIADDDNL